MANTLVFLETTHARSIEHVLKCFAGLWASSR